MGEENIVAQEVYNLLFKNKLLFKDLFQYLCVTLNLFSMKFSVKFDFLESVLFKVFELYAAVHKSSQ